jgi:RNA polymerase sigma-70 factor (ECF subfamily)
MISPLCVTEGRVDGVDAESARWLRDLQSDGATGQAAADRLHTLLLAAARRELRFRAGAAAVPGVERDDLAHQAAADASVAVLAKLDDFAGRSRFTTWAYKFVMLEVSRKLARHMWRGQPLLVEIEDWEELPGRFGFTPAEIVESRELIAALTTAIKQDLTDRQRTVLGAIVLRGVPLDEVVAELSTTRGAIYKILFDARRRLRTSLEAQGHAFSEMSA